LVAPVSIIMSMSSIVMDVTAAVVASITCLPRVRRIKIGHVDRIANSKSLFDDQVVPEVSLLISIEAWV
jgi:hypothetical protein